MSFSSNTTKTGPLLGDNVNTSFDYEFLILNSSHLEVIYADEFGIETILVEGTHYSVSGVGGVGGGSITYPLSGSPLSDKEKLTLRRKPPFTQEAAFPLHGGYIGPNHETAFDLLAMQALYLREELSRAVKVGISTTDNPDDILQILAQVQKDVFAYLAAAQAAQTAAETAESGAQGAEQGAQTAKAGSETARDQAGTYRDEAQTAARKTLSVYVYTAIGGETSLSGEDDDGNVLAYVPGVLLVEMNGSLLENGVDFTATNGTSLTDIPALPAGAKVIIYALGTFSIVEDLAAIQAEGDTQVGNVQTEGTNQVGAVNVAGTTQTNSVNSAGATQLSTVNNEGSTQVANVQAEGTAQITAVQTEGATQTANMQAHSQDIAGMLNQIKSNDAFLVNHLGALTPNPGNFYSDHFERNGLGALAPKGA